MLKTEQATRPKLASNPEQLFGEQFRSASASASMKRAAFQPAFASKTAFGLDSKAHPKSGLRQEWRDLDADGLGDALVHPRNDEIVGVNDTVANESNWRALQPYCDTAINKRLDGDRAQGFRAADDTSEGSGIEATEGQSLEAGIRYDIDEAY
jgi:hypothetical protein